MPVTSRLMADVVTSAISQVAFFRHQRQTYQPIMITIYHTSPVEIETIRENGRFGDCLFFSLNEYAMGKVAAVYALETDESEIISGDDLDFAGNAEKQAIADLIQIADGVIDEYEAFDLLTGKSSVWNLLSDRIDDTDALSEIDFDVQRLQGRIAKQDGFAAFQGRDEQGEVFIVPMAGKLDRLVRVN